MGDAIMAIFNAPLPQPDHTLRAVRAALTMKADIEAYHQTVAPQFRLDFGIGINCGTAVVGMVGTRTRLDYSAIGDDVNLAKRIQEISGKSQILISHAAYQPVAREVIAVPLGPVKVKGREQPVEIYEVKGLWE
jgi:class 3 adenylate cyclase